MPAKDGIAKVISIIALVSQAFSAFIWIFWYIKFPSLTTPYTWFAKLDNYTVNSNWALLYLPLLMGILTGLCAVFELLLVIMPTKVKFVNAPVFRGLLYIGLGFLVLSAAGTFGAVAGILSGVVGLAVLGGQSWASL